MKAKMLVSLAGPHWSCYPGQVLENNEDAGPTEQELKGLIKSGLAEEVKAPGKAPAKSKK